MPELSVTYNGPVNSSGLLDDDTNIALQHGDALDKVLAQTLYESVGPMETLPIAKTRGVEEQSADVNAGFKTYIPTFWDREVEYGEDHHYYEALCHGLLDRNPISTFSARWGTDQNALPATAQIAAFIETVRDINQDLLSELHAALLKHDIPDTIAQLFVDGAFRNVAIQIHYGKGPGDEFASTCLRHVDHVVSSLHLAVSLHGERRVFFMKDKKHENSLELTEKQGCVYCSAPAVVNHYVSYPTLTEDERAVSLQCRTMLPVDTARWLGCKGHSVALAVSEVLEKRNLKIPTHQQWEAAMAKHFGDLPETKPNPRRGCVLM